LRILAIAGLLPAIRALNRVILTLSSARPELIRGSQDISATISDNLVN